jgi:hypothetical protein
MGAPSLTMHEAAERAALIAVERYDVEVDLRDLLEGQVLESTSTVTFTCRQPGAATFVDCVADVRSATLNGVELDPSTATGGRIPLTDLAEHNVLVVSASQCDTGSVAGMLRTVDPSDGLVYFWTSFEPDEARRAWACFDQPDLKAPHAFVVRAPESWTVLSNRGPDATEPAEPPDGGSTWRFPDTPPLSTYVVVVNARFKSQGYRDDMGPPTHPIRAAVPDVAAATANFDAITYIKGLQRPQAAGRLRRRGRVRGGAARLLPRPRLRQHRPGRPDGRGRDRRRPGPDALDARVAGPGRHRHPDPARRAGGGGRTRREPPRPHRLDIGCYTRKAAGLRRTASVPVELTGASTPVELPAADLYLVNDDDLTIAAVRSDEPTTRALLDAAADLPSPLGRGLPVTTAWDMLARMQRAKSR